LNHLQLLAKLIQVRFHVREFLFGLDVGHSLAFKFLLEPIECSFAVFLQIKIKFRD